MQDVRGRQKAPSKSERFDVGDVETRKERTRLGMVQGMETGKRGFVSDMMGANERKTKGSFANEEVYNTKLRQFTENRSFVW